MVGTPYRKDQAKIVLRKDFIYVVPRIQHQVSPLTSEPRRHRVLQGSNLG